MMMKTLVQTILILLMGAQVSLARVWVVNNNVGGGGDFTDAQTAADNATAGDTLYLTPSPTAYELNVIFKPLFILGNGYFLEENGITLNDETPVNAVLNFTGTILEAASGMHLKSLQISGFTFETEELTLERCYVTGQIRPANSLTGITIKQSWLTGHIFNGSPITKIEASGTYFGGDVHADSSSVLSHCVFARYLVGTQSGVYNSIFLTTNASWLCSLFDATRAMTYSFNFFVIDEPTSGTVSLGNTWGAVPQTLFVTATGQPTDGIYQLRTGSPAAGQGLNGADVGMFDGANPYILGGVPQLPRISQFRLQSVVSQESGMNFEATIESEN